jgi:hypothetical protein
MKELYDKRIASATLATRSCEEDKARAEAEVVRMREQILAVRIEAEERAAAFVIFHLLSHSSVHPLLLNVLTAISN